MGFETDQLRSHYDAVPYLSGAFVESHPDRLRTVAALTGMFAPSVTACRVLEIGCGIGRNLIPMAQALPGSRFLGIDLSPRQIAIGNEALSKLGLSNIELRCQDLLDFRTDEGSFDYIIAHGIYSWVPQEARDQLLRICGQHLTPSGLVYISYSALPGAHLRQVLRDLMLMHCGNQADPGRRVALAKEILSFANQPSPGWKTYKDWVNVAVSSMVGQNEWYLLHDDLEPVNHPLYFDHFANDIAKHGLSYVGDARPTQDIFHQLPRATQQQVEQFAGGDQTRRQQYLDFLECRSYRAAVLCRANADPHTGSPAKAVQDLYVAGRIVEQTSRDPKTDGAIWKFTSTVAETTLTFHDARPAAAFRLIAEAWPHAVPFHALVAAAFGAHSGEGDKLSLVLAESILTGYRIGLLELWSRPTSFLARNVEHPKCTALARLQIAAGDPLVNLRHQRIDITGAMRGLMPLLDGSRERSELLREFTRLIERGELRLAMTDGSIGPQRNLSDILSELIHGLSINSLLVA